VKIALCIFNYFPYGGLQRDFIRILTECLKRGHQVSVYTMKWQGEIIQNLDLHLIVIPGLSNHKRAKRFDQYMSKVIVKENFDAVVGFNKISSLDFYFAGDICYKAKFTSWKNIYFIAHWLLSRYRTYFRLEEEVFTPKAKTKIFYLTPAQKESFINTYGTQENRFYLLPPGIKKNTLNSEQKITVRNNVRAELNFTNTDIVLLLVATNFYLKGLDRVLCAINSIKNKNIKLLVIGDDKGKSFRNYTRHLSLKDQVKFIGVTDDVLRYMLAADILVHPARSEAAGMVLVEAIAAGLPILTTANCGYQFHVKSAAAGIVLALPFKNAQFKNAIINMLDKEKLKTWQQNALNYAAKEDLYNLASRSVDLIEQTSQILDT